MPRETHRRGGRESERTKGQGEPEPSGGDERETPRQRAEGDKHTTAGGREVERERETPEGTEHGAKEPAAPRGTHKRLSCKHYP